MSVRDRLRLARESLALTKAEVGRKIGVSRSKIAHIESGKVGLPSKEILDRLANLYGIDASELYRGFGYVSSNKAAPRSPKAALADVQMGISSYIPVYTSLDHSNLIEYISTSWTHPTYEIITAYKIRGLNYKALVKDGDIIIVNSHTRPITGDLVLCNQENESQILKYEGVNMHNIVKGVITHVLVTLKE